MEVLLQSTCLPNNSGPIVRQHKRIVQLLEENENIESAESLWFLNMFEVFVEYASYFQRLETTNPQLLKKLRDLALQWDSVLGQHENHLFSSQNRNLDQGDDWLLLVWSLLVRPERLPEYCRLPPLSSQDDLLEHVCTILPQPVLDMVANASLSDCMTRLCQTNCNDKYRLERMLDNSPSIRDSLLPRGVQQMKNVSLNSVILYQIGWAGKEEEYVLDSTLEAFKKRGGQMTVVDFRRTFLRLVAEFESMPFKNTYRKEIERAWDIEADSATYLCVYDRSNYMGCKPRNVKTLAVLHPNGVDFKVLAQSVLAGILPTPDKPLSPFENVPDPSWVIDKVYHPPSEILNERRNLQIENSALFIKNQCERGSRTILVGKRKLCNHRLDQNNCDLLVSGLYSNIIKSNEVSSFICDADMEKHEPRIKRRRSDSGLVSDLEDEEEKEEAQDEEKEPIPDYYEEYRREDMLRGRVITGFKIEESFQSDDYCTRYREEVRGALKAVEGDLSYRVDGMIREYALFMLNYTDPSKWEKSNSFQDALNIALRVGIPRGSIMNQKLAQLVNDMKDDMIMKEKWIPDPKSRVGCADIPMMEFIPGRVLDKEDSVPVPNRDNEDLHIIMGGKIKIQLADGDFHAELHIPEIRPISKDMSPVEKQVIEEDKNKLVAFFQYLNEISRTDTVDVLFYKKGMDEPDRQEDENSKEDTDNCIDLDMNLDDLMDMSQEMVNYLLVDGDYNEDEDIICIRNDHLTDANVIDLTKEEDGDDVEKFIGQEEHYRKRQQRDHQEEECDEEHRAKRHKYQDKCLEPVHCPPVQPRPIRACRLKGEHNNAPASTPTTTNSCYNTEAIVDMLKSVEGSVVTVHDNVAVIPRRGMRGIVTMKTESNIYPKLVFVGYQNSRPKWKKMLDRCNIHSPEIYFYHCRKDVFVISRV